MLSENGEELIYDCGQRIRPKPILLQCLFQNWPTDGCREFGGECGACVRTAARSERLILFSNLAERLSKGEFQ